MTGGSYRPEYMEVLALLAKASAAVRAGGSIAPVLVGGAAVEFYTAGQFMSGDFDFVLGDDEAFAEALVAVGFERGDGLAYRRMQFVHQTLDFSVELVSNDYFDGRGDKGRIRSLQIAGAELRMAPTEDLIADRLGEWTGGDRKDNGRLNQAVLLYRLAEDLDVAYLDKRIREETSGDLSLEQLIEFAE